MVRGFERVVLVVSTIAVALWLLVFVIVAAVVRVLGAWLADRVA
jgi:nitrate/nitrite transporter NarK